MGDSFISAGNSKLQSAESKVRPEKYTYTFHELVSMFRRRRRFVLGTITGLLLLCIFYCLIVPNQYEASARVALRMQATSTLSLDGVEAIAPVSILSTPLQLETLVNVIRSEQLAWRVITELKLYESPAFCRNFAKKFPGFDPQHPTPQAQTYLFETFGKRLKVHALPRTFLIEIRYRSKDPAQAAEVVNALIGGYAMVESQGRMDATMTASTWLQGQLTELTAQVEGKEKHLADFEREHGFLSLQQTVQGGQPVETLHDPAIEQADEAGRQWAAANGDQMLRQALYAQAKRGDPEQVLAANPELQAEMGPGGATLLLQLHAQLSQMSVEMAQLKAEHGPKFPRVVELQRASLDIERQIKTGDAKLAEAFRRSWKAAEERQKLLRGQLDSRMTEGMAKNDWTMQYAVLREDVQSGRELCARLQKRIQEAGLSAGIHASSIVVVDYARQPFKPVSPDLLLYLAITLFVSLWLALGGALLMDAFWPPRQLPQGLRVAMVLFAAMLAGLSSAALGQAPTPNTSGLPSGVVKIAETPVVTVAPNPKDAPAIWNAAAPGTQTGLADQGARMAGVAMALPIAVGDFLLVSEFHTPEFRSEVRVAADGTAILPLVGQVSLAGLSEQQAAHAVEKAFVDEGMLLHPQVALLVTQAVGKDVSVLGEVARPGVYPYTAHHRLLDVISAASGLSTNAGRLVSVFHRDDEHVARLVALDPTGTDSKTEHNPELAPGDTVLVSRAGLAYVIGDVVRPGGFAVDPVQGLTVVQALSLAWGSTPNASVSKAILIRDQAGGRTLTKLNLRRMIRGQDPDLPVRDRDILFVPDSATKTLMNKSLEAAIQSAIGVSIYAGLVYSQRF